MERQKFITDICKKGIKGIRHHKVRNSWGVYDAYKAIRKKAWGGIGVPVKEHVFYSVIRKINKCLAEEISNGVLIALPCRMGRLELRKAETGASFNNGRLKINYPIDWQATMNLWFDDKEARENKILVRYQDGFAYKVRYLKRNADYINKCFYTFHLNRNIKKTLKEKILNGQTDAL